MFVLEKYRNSSITHQECICGKEISYKSFRIFPWLSIGDFLKGIKLCDVISLVFYFMRSQGSDQHSFKLGNQGRTLLYFLYSFRFRKPTLTYKFFWRSYTRYKTKSWCQWIVGVKSIKLFYKTFFFFKKFTSSQLFCCSHTFLYLHISHTHILSITVLLKK